MPSPHSETCTCTHVFEAHYITGMDVTNLRIIDPCGIKGCPCQQFEAVDRG